MNDDKLHFYKINTAINTFYCYGKGFNNSYLEFKELFTATSICVSNGSAKAIYRDVNLSLPVNEGEYIVLPIDDDKFLNELDNEIDKAGSIDCKTTEVINLFEELRNNKLDEVESSMLKK